MNCLFRLLSHFSIRFWFYVLQFLRVFLCGRGVMPGDTLLHAPLPVLTSWGLFLLHESLLPPGLMLSFSPTHRHTHTQLLTLCYTLLAVNTF